MQNIDFTKLIKVTEVSTVPVQNERKIRVFFLSEKVSLFTLKDRELSAHKIDPVQVYRKLMPQVLEKVGLNPNMKGQWSRKAGCSCGCSPGFVMEDRGMFDVYVTYEVNEEMLKSL